MSDPVNHSEIEDVLSSIRRLVSDSLPEPRQRSGAAGGKLVLTPALRVVENETPEPGDEERAAGDAPAGAAPEEAAETARPAMWHHEPVEVLTDSFALREPVSEEPEPEEAATGAEAADAGEEEDAAAQETDEAALSEAEHEAAWQAEAEPAPVDAFAPEEIDAAEEDRAASAVAFEPDAMPEEAEEAAAPAWPGDGADTVPEEAEEAEEAAAAPEQAEEAGDMPEEDEAAAEAASGDALQDMPAGEDEEQPDTGAEDDAPAASADGWEEVSLEERIAELEAAVAGSGGDWEPDGSEVRHHVVSFDELVAKDTVVEMPADPVEPRFTHAAGFGEMRPTPAAAPEREEAESEAAPQDLAEEIAVQDGEEAAAGAGAAEPGAESTGDDGAGPEETDILDEEMLRELVGEIVRKEFQGALGERITRNVRKLVRREISRAMASREFE